MLRVQVITRCQGCNHRGQHVLSHSDATEVTIEIHKHDPITENISVRPLACEHHKEGFCNVAPPHDFTQCLYRFAWPDVVDKPNWVAPTAIHQTISDMRTGQTNR